MICRIVDEMLNLNFLGLTHEKNLIQGVKNINNFIIGKKILFKHNRAKCLINDIKIYICILYIFFFVGAWSCIFDVKQRRAVSVVKECMFIFNKPFP